MIQKDIEVLLGGGYEKFVGVLDQAESYGYTIVRNRSELMNVWNASKLLGLFANSYMSYENQRDTNLEPSLAEMTNISIQILSKSEKGFFLMVEGGRIDHACHANDVNNTIGEMLAFNEAIKIALNYAMKDNNTLVIVTADHETGGLMVLDSEIINETTTLNVKWSTTGHTANMVPVYGYGPNASKVSTFHDNTDVGNFLFNVFGSNEKREAPLVKNQKVARKFLVHGFGNQMEDLKSKTYGILIELIKGVYCDIPLKAH
jgi:alkaline phosphatase